MKLIVLLFLLYSKLLTGQNLLSQDSLRTQFIDSRTDNRSVYGSAPITHINPNFNTINYALGIDYPNYIITPDTENPNYIPNTTQTAELKVSGWSARPHISVSLRNIGLGFSVGRGERKVDYNNIYDFNGTYQRTDQESELAYTEVGLFLYFVPYPNLMGRKLRATIILGGRSTNAKHTYVEEYFSNSNVNPSVIPIVKRYSVNTVELGLNFRFHFFKSFSIIPWANYEYIDTRSIEAVASSEKFNPDVQSQLEKDILFFWHYEPKVRYGIDFAIRISRFEIGIGGVLGSIVATGNNKESITDNAISLNLSFDQKGH